MKSAPDDIRLIEKIGYGFGDVASCLFWQTFATFLLYFYTDIFGITASAAATMFLVTRCWDLLFDPVMGVIADRTTTRYGKFRPYLLWIPIPLGIMAILTFTTPDFSTNGKLVYAYVTYGLLMMLYSAINVPYAALLGVITAKAEQRTALSSFRMMGAFFGSLLVQYSNYGLAFYFSVKDSNLADAAKMTVTAVTKAFQTTAAAQPEIMEKTLITPAGYQLTTVVYALLAIAFFFATFFLTRERVVPLIDRNPSLKRDAVDLLSNRPWLILVAVTIFSNGFNGVRTGVIVYYFKYYVHNEALAGMYLVVGSLVGILGIYLIQFITPRFGKKKPYILCMVVSAGLAVMSFWVGPKEYAAMFAYQLLISFFIGPPAAMIWSLYADAADYSELKTGRRATGLIFSASGMCQKLGWTIASSITGYLLTYYNFQANVEQSVQTQTGIRLMVTVFPAVCCAGGAILMFFYPLNETKVREIEVDLRAARSLRESAALSP